MIIPASDEFVIKIFNQVTSEKVKSITYRKLYDYSRYSMLEILSFDNKDKKYVLKTLKRPVKHEIAIHRFVNNFPINGAKFVAGYSSNFLNLHFIVMEFIENLIPIYNFEDKDLIEDYAELSKNLASFHVNSTKFLKINKKLRVYNFDYDYYNNLIGKFNEKIPVLGKTINHELYLTPDIIERFKQKKEVIEKTLIKIKPLKRTLVHGDFDIGNIFFKIQDDQNKKIIAIDWGLSHIDLPIIDMANLLNSLETITEDDRKYIYECYLRVAQKKFPKNYSLTDFQTFGMILHRLFFIEYQLTTLETSSTSMEEYYEQIHNAMHSLCSLVDDLN